MRGERREKVRRRRRATLDYLRKRTEKVAKVVSHVNEVAEQKTDRSDRLQQTNLTSLNTSSTRRPCTGDCSSSSARLRCSGVNTSAAVVWRWLVRDDEAGAACILVVHWPPRQHPSHNRQETGWCTS